jgi:tight adherence protein B
MFTSPLFLGVLAFVCVAALVGAATLRFRERPSTKVEDRLSVMTGLGRPSSGKDAMAAQASILAQPLEERHAILENLVSRFGNLPLMLEQADTSMTVSRLLTICGGMAMAGAVAGIAVGINFALIPVMAMVLGVLPIFWLGFRRRRRLKAFAVQFPDALEMMARSLRAGQSLASGFSNIAEEMSAPVGVEFGRVFEEQNLGVPLEESLNDLCERVPNLDLKFFCTAVVLQRQTGGDLAEILDKIGSLVRQRFAIWGQVQALTGEGRLSGVVLLGLPIVLFFVVYQMNPDYVTVLFTDPLGKKMLVYAIIMQILGALVIRKIVNIKV